MINIYALEQSLNHRFRQVTSRVIKYSEEPHAFGDYLLGIYGWFTSPLMEYFVVEDYDTYMPWSTADPLGAPITNDGSTYNLYTTWSHEDRPSIHGRVRFVQVWAVRTNRRKSGLVDMRIFFNAWRSRSVPLGVQNYQVVGLEGTFTGGYTCIKAEEVTNPRLISNLSLASFCRCEQNANPSECLAVRLDVLPMWWRELYRADLLF
jgi:hypothetical protein